MNSVPDIGDLFSRLVWQPPLLNELEPSYSRRCIYPQLRRLVARYYPHFVVRSDGHLRPQPVIVSGGSYYPDLAINFGHERRVAVEVKFYTDAANRGGLMSGLGQASTYQAFGYTEAFLVLISKFEGQGLTLDEVCNYNSRTANGVRVLQLS